MSTKGLMKIEEPLTKAWDAGYASEARKAAAENSRKTVVRKSPGRPFKPGESGNPGGRPKKDRTLQERAQELMPAAMDALEAALSNPKERMMAISMVLDRGYGKPLQTVDVGLRNLSDDALVAEFAFIRAAFPGLGLSTEAPGAAAGAGAEAGETEAVDLLSGHGASTP